MTIQSAVSSVWKNWFNGLIGGAIGSAANSITVLIIDPAKFNPANDGGWTHLAIAVTVSFVVGAALYLKQHPTPFSDESADGK